VGFPMIMKRVATSAAGWTRAVLIVMIPATLIGMLRFFFCKEDPSVDPDSNKEPIRMKDVLELLKRNRYVWLYALIMLSYNLTTNLACGSYYFTYIVGDLDKLGILSVFGIILLPLMLTFPAIMKKLGTMGKMIALFAVIGIVGYVIVFFSGAYAIGVYIGYLLATLAGLPIAYYGILFVMNICNYNERIGLRRMEASSSALANFCSKLGAALGAYVTGLVLFIGGYISSSDAVQPESALMAIRIDYSIVPIIFMVIIAVCALAFGKLEKENKKYADEKKAKEAAVKA
jgi:Na+/melibiose symporter-like transporter